MPEKIVFTSLSRFGAIGSTRATFAPVGLGPGIPGQVLVAFPGEAVPLPEALATCLFSPRLRSGTNRSICLFRANLGLGLTVRSTARRQRA